MPQVRSAGASRRQADRRPLVPAPKRTRRPAPLETDQTALLVPLDAVVPGANARAGWDKLDDRLRQLASSIQERGLLEPLLVRERKAASGGQRTFELVAGFRRLAAARSLDLARVPVRVLVASDAEARATNLAENLSREDLPDAEALRFLEELHQTYGWGVRQIGREIGRPPSWVSDLLAVGRSARERRGVERGTIAIATATRLVRLRDAAPAAREKLLRRVDAGERVLLDEVPRLQALRPGTSGALPQATKPARGQPQEQPAPRVRFREILELSSREQALYRNMRLSVRQVLAVVDKAWEAQGRHHRLPSDLRRELEATREFIDQFLARDTGG